MDRERGGWEEKGETDRQRQTQQSVRKEGFCDNQQRRGQIVPSCSLHQILKELICLTQDFSSPMPFMLLNQWDLWDEEGGFSHSEYHLPVTRPKDSSTHLFCSSEWNPHSYNSSSLLPSSHSSSLNLFLSPTVSLILSLTLLPSQPLPFVSSGPSFTESGHPSRPGPMGLDSELTQEDLGPLPWTQDMNLLPFAGSIFSCLPCGHCWVALHCPALQLRLEVTPNLPWWEINGLLYTQASEGTFMQAIVTRTYVHQRYDKLILVWFWVVGMQENTAGKQGKAQL